MSEKDIRIGDQAEKLRDLAALLTDAEAARSGGTSGVGLILSEISDTLFNLASKPGTASA